MGKAKLNFKPPTVCLLLAWRLALACLAWAAGSATAQINISNVAAVNITPSSFSLVWSGSSASKSPGTPAISVFADSAGVANLAGQLGIDFFPLHTGNPALTNSYDRRLDQAALRQKTSSQGLVEVRVSGCAPNTTYYYQLQETDAQGHRTVWPSAGPLPAVTTAVANDFVIQSLQLVLDVPGVDPSGSIVILSSGNTPSLLAAVVGDGAGINQAYFNLSDLLDASGGTNFLPVGTQQFTAMVLSASNFVSQTYSLDFSTNFVVGAGTQFSFGSFLALSLGSSAVLAGQGGSIPITLEAATFLASLSFTLSLPTNRFGSLSLQALVPQLASASLRPLGPNTLLVALGAGPGQNLLGNQQIAQLNFVAASNQTSAFVPLTPQTLQGTNTDGSVVSQTVAQPGRLVIVGQQALLEALRTSGGARSLALYGRPGASYQIQYSTDLSKAGNWTGLIRVPMTSIMEVFPLDNSPPAAFYRAYEFTSPTPFLDIGRPVNGTVTIVLYGSPWLAYEVDYTKSLSFPIIWHLLDRLPFTGSFQILKVNSNGPMAFYRAHTLNADPPLLEAYLENQNRSLLAYGLPGSSYTLQYATNLAPVTTWSSLLSYTLTNSFQAFTNLGNAQPRIFYRIKKP